jgi:lipopolysaccharide transport system ATP-binding protein
VIYLRRGRVQFDGPAAEGIELYEADSRLTAAPFARGAGITDPARCPIVITDMTLMDEAGRPASVFDHGQRLRLRLDYEVRGAVDAPNFIVVFVRCDDLACCNYSTELDAVRVSAAPGPGRIELVTPPLRLVAERYRILVLVREKGFKELVCAQVGDSFQVRHPVLDTSFGAFYEAGEWTSLDKAPPPAPSPEAVAPHAHAVTASQP